MLSFSAKFIKSIPLLLSTNLPTFFYLFFLSVAENCCFRLRCIDMIRSFFEQAFTSASASVSNFFRRLCEDFSLFKTGSFLQQKIFRSKLRMVELKEELLPLSDAQWEKDADVDNCKGCNVQFTVSRRKHHCRLVALCAPFVCEVWKEVFFLFLPASSPSCLH